MFVCQECINKNGCWHPTVSVGPCEICGKYRECGDCRHKHHHTKSFAQLASEQIEHEGFAAFVDELPPEASETEPVEGDKTKFKIAFKDGSKITLGICVSFVENPLA